MKVSVIKQVGRLFLRVVSLGRGKPEPGDRRQPLVSFLGALIAVGAIAAAVLWLLPPSSSHVRGNLFDSREEFQAYIARLELASVPTAAAIDRLTSRGFHCETFNDANVSCYRQVKGSLCGERQFVDLLVPGKEGAAHAVATRFGLTCL
jgi:hypothetical protein